MVVGPRFGAFLPLGSRANLEHDIVFLLEAYNQPYGDVMAMPSSRRHRLVQIRKEIVQSRGKNKGAQSRAYSTGLSQSSRTPTAPGGG